MLEPNLTAIDEDRIREMICAEAGKTPEEEASASALSLGIALIALIIAATIVVTALIF